MPSSNSPRDPARCRDRELEGVLLALTALSRWAPVSSALVPRLRREPAFMISCLGRLELAE